MLWGQPIVVQIVEPRRPPLWVRLHDRCKGYRTIIFAAGLAAAPPLLEYLGGVNWQSLGLHPATAVAISAVVVALRAVTRSAIGCRHAADTEHHDH